MRKLSAMGSSKYEFNPEQFDEDMKRHMETHKRKETEITKVLEQFINRDTWQEDNFRTITKALRLLKIKYDL